MKKKVVESSRSEVADTEPGHRSAEQALDSAYEKYRSIFQYAPVGIYQATPEGRFLFVNPAFASMLGYASPEEMISKVTRPNRELYVSGEDIQGLFRDLDRTGEASNVEIRLKNKSGEVFWASINARAVKDPGGNTLYYDGFVADITERKQAEQALRQNEEMLSAIFRSLTDVIFLCDKGFNVLWANEAARKLFGPDIVGRKCRKVFAGPGDGPAVMECVKMCLADGRVHEREISLKTPNGPMEFWNTVNVVSRGKEGRPQTVISILRDVTEKKALQAEAMRAAQLASLGELAAGVAHEINNPINAIINLAQILEDDLVETGAGSDLPARIIKEGRRISTIVGNLLSFARKESQRTKPVEPAKLIDDALGLTRAQMQKQGIRILVDLAKDLPLVMARGQELQQVFLNILSNARHALNQRYPGQDPDKIIRITGEKAGRGKKSVVRLVFEDHGTGIPSEVLDRVFDPFFSTKPKGVGTGLGLSISYKIIQAHDGKMQVQSKPGVNTRVIVDLPAKKSES